MATLRTPSQPLVDDSNSNNAMPTQLNSPPPLSTSASYTIKALALMRIGLGIGCVLAPTATFALFRLSLGPMSSTLARLFGARELVLGELLYSAKDEVSADGTRRELKRALWANMAGDASDIGSGCFALATGALGRIPAAMIVGGAVTGVGMGMYGLRSLSGANGAVTEETAKSK